MASRGYFNDITNLREKEGGRPNDQRKIDAFKSLIEDIGLGDLGFNGHIFTWSNNRGEMIG